MIKTSECGKVTKGLKKSKESSKGIVWTIGHSTRTLEEFIELLQHYGIAALADVRRWPTSRKVPHFSRMRLEAALPRAGVRYLWLGEALGGRRRGGYEAHMKTACFKEGVACLERLARAASLAVMCAEALPWRCHRRFIARELQRRGFEVVHIISKGREWRPRASI